MPWCLPKNKTQMSLISFRDLIFKMMNLLEVCAKTLATTVQDCVIYFAYFEIESMWYSPSEDYILTVFLLTILILKKKEIMYYLFYTWHETGCLKLGT